MRGGEGCAAARASGAAASRGSTRAARTTGRNETNGMHTPNRREGKERRMPQECMARAHPASDRAARGHRGDGVPYPAPAISSSASHRAMSCGSRASSSARVAVCCAAARPSRSTAGSASVA